MNLLHKNKPLNFTMSSYEEILANSKQFVRLYSQNNLDEIKRLMQKGVFKSSDEIFHIFSNFSFHGLVASDELILLVSDNYRNNNDLLLILMEVYYDKICTLTVGPSPGNANIESGNLVRALKTLIHDEEQRNSMIVTLAEKIHDSSRHTIPRLFQEMVNNLVDKVKAAYNVQA